MNTRIAALSMFLVGCLPIPWKKNYVMWPKRTVRVVDEKGAPIAGAKVRVVRDRQPHGRNDEIRTFTADAKGEVKLEREEKVLRVFPLMMHGVPFFSFRVCAESKGNAANTASWSNAEESSDLEVKLSAGSMPCADEPNLEVPPAKKMRVDAVVRQEDKRFLVHLAMTPDADAHGAELVKPGAEPLKVTEVKWQSDGTGTIRRAQVYVSGDALAYEYGDLVDVR